MGSDSDRPISAGAPEPESTPREHLASWLSANQRRLASQIMSDHFDRAPEFVARYGERGRAKCTEDVGYHLEYLRAAVATSSPTLFLNYVAWIKVLLAGFGIPESHLAQSLDLTRAALEAELDPSWRDLAIPLLDEAALALPSFPCEPSSPLCDANPHAELASRYLEALLAGDRNTAGQMILDAAERGLPVADIYLYVVNPTQREIGRLWQTNRISVAKEHYCTAATQQIIARLHPWISASERVGLRVIASSVGSELHELGARMVADFFEMAGWDVYYLGASTPLPGLISAMIERRADLVALSATMTRNVPIVADFVREIRACPETAAILILVGGYPFNVAPDLWRYVGADGTTSSPDAAVHLARLLVEERKAAGSAPTRRA